MKNARQIVLDLLIQMSKSTGYSNIMLDKKLAESNLSRQDKSFATVLFYGVIERRITLDAVILAHSNISMKKITPDVLEILRMGIYQILYMDSVPDSAAVNESVKLAEYKRKPRVKGYINAVLRGFIRNNKKLPSSDNPITSLSIEFSSPEWLVEKWRSEYGQENLHRILESSVTVPPIAIRTNTLKISTQELLGELNATGIKAAISPLAPDSIIIEGTGSIQNLDLYQNGFFHVQDISAQLCCHALEPKSGETILDLCSAPGGKAFTIAQLMNDEGNVLAFDLHRNRTRLIEQGGERLGINIIKVSQGDAKVFDDGIPLADRVICDVPCSGLGIIRRKPEIKYKNNDDFAKLPEIQLAILCNAAKYVKVGGTLLYTTCTLSRAENDNVADAFYNKHNENFSRAKLSELLIDSYGETSKDGSVKTLFPDINGGDGFFIAAFRRVK